MTRAPFRLGVVGKGRAAGALVPRWIAAGHPCLWQQGRGDDIPLALRPPVDVIIVAVRDGDIGGVVAELATRPTAPHEVWLHLSGSLPGSLCRVDRDRPRAAGCLHPLMALTGASGLAPLGAVAGLDGDPDAVAVARTLAGDAGLRPRIIDAAHKTLYHAAAVTVAGHATALFAQGMRLMEAAGMAPEDARDALAPLFRSAAENVAAAPPETAVTGPIARGDATTVAAHLEALAALGDPRIEAVYRLLGAEALTLSRDGIPATQRAAIAALLRPSDG